MSALVAGYDVSGLERLTIMFDAFDPARREHGSTGHVFSRVDEILEDVS